MRIVDQRTIKIVKGKHQEEVERFNSRVLEFDGFIKRELLLNIDNPEYDLLLVQMHWESKDKLLAFKKSDLHREGHKNRQPNPNIIEHKMQLFTLENK